MAIRVDDVDLDRDRALVRQFQAGDDTAFDELYRRYHDRLERFCLKRVGDQHAAEEVAQEAFTRALIALPALEGDRRFYPWVSVIASRLCIDHHRRQARSEPIPDPDPGPVTGGQDEIVDAVDNFLAVAALGRLAPRHQDVLQLREVQGWSYRRIADHYGVRVGTVETLLFRARRALRREFHVVDGAGLAAIPLFGRLLGLAARIRDRLAPFVPAGGASSAVAAAATATAAAVALAVVPMGRPAPPLVPPAAAVAGPAIPIPAIPIPATPIPATASGPVSPSAPPSTAPRATAIAGGGVAASQATASSPAIAATTTAPATTAPITTATTVPGVSGARLSTPATGLGTTVVGTAPAIGPVTPPIIVPIPPLGLPATLSLPLPSVPIKTGPLLGPLTNVVTGSLAGLLR